MTARGLFPRCSDIIAWHVRGTRYGIHMDPADGLLRAGEEGVQLTWMDAKVDDWVVTPRIGKPVEINALWYNALRVMEKLKLALGRTRAAGQDGAARFRRPRRAGQSLVPPALLVQRCGSASTMWWTAPDGDDASLRPNQIFALSLQSRPVDGRAGARRAQSGVAQHLFTPYGLRTLSPDDPRYIGTL